MRQKYSLIHIALLLVAFLPSVLITPADSAHETPVYGGRVIAARYEDTMTINPILAPGITSLETCGLIFDGLMRLDTQGMPQLALAKDYTVSSDGKVYTFYLLENVTFHDGIGLTAEDVKFTFDQAVFNKSVSFIYRSYYQPLQSVVVVNNYTVEFHLKNASGPFISWMNLPVIPRHVYSSNGRTDLNNDPHNFSPIGTGPFKFHEYVKGDHLTLKAYDGCWHGRPYLDEVVFRVIPDPGTMAIALERGEVDFARDISFSDTVRLALDSSAGKSNITVLIGPPNYIIGIRACFQSPYFNKTNPNSLKLRQAIGYAIDREGISRSVYYGLGTTAHSPLPTAYPFWNNEVMATGSFNYNTTKANEILDEIYPKGGDGWRIELELAGATADRDYLELVKVQLERVGIKIRLSVTEKSAYWAHILGPYELGTWTWVAVPDPGWVQNSWASWTTSAYTIAAFGRANDTGSYLSSGPATEIDDLLRQAEVETNATARQELYYRFQEIVGFEDPAPIFTNFKPWPHAYSDDLRGIEPVPMMLYETCLSNSLAHVWRVSEATTETEEPFPTMLAIAAAAIVVAVVAVIAAVIMIKRKGTK